MESKLSNDRVGSVRIGRKDLGDQVVTLDSAVHCVNDLFLFLRGEY